MKEKFRGSIGFILQVAIFIAVITVIGILVFQLSEDGRTEISTTDATVTNETLTTVTESGEVLANHVQCGFNSLSITQIRNTSNFIVASGNYSYTSGGVVSTVGANHNNTNWLVTYTYKYGGLGCNATVEADKGQAKLFGNLDLLALAVIFGAIVFVIMKVLPIKLDSF